MHKTMDELVFGVHDKTTHLFSSVNFSRLAIFCSLQASAVDLFCMHSFAHYPAEGQLCEAETKTD